MHHSLNARMTSTLRWLLQNGPQAQRSAASEVGAEILKKGFAKKVLMTSPYPADKGKAIDHLQITDAGLDFIGGA